MKINYIDTPRSFRFHEAVEARMLMLKKPHIEPLAKYVASLRRRYQAWEFQDFDPCDGGISADILFLMEKPGPMTSKNGNGSGFISRNNNDPTAEAIFNFMNMANIPRSRTLLWNVIPGWNGTIKVTAAEHKEGVKELRNLFWLLPNLKTVVLVGRKAQRARKLLSNLNLKIITSAHPSPKVRAINLAMWESIPQQWAISLVS